MTDPKKFEGHTPGPREVIHLYTNVNIVRAYIGDEEGVSIASFKHEPDAHLFAAAPDLLEENKRLRELVRMYDRLYGPEMLSREQHKALRAAIPAAKKALQ